MPNQNKYAPDRLISWAGELFVARGTDTDKAETVSPPSSSKADLLGHDTHGLALLGPYLARSTRGPDQPTGNYAIVATCPAVMLWDGGGLPGPWLTDQAVKSASAPRDLRHGNHHSPPVRPHRLSCSLPRSAGA